MWQSSYVDHENKVCGKKELSYKVAHLDIKINGWELFQVPSFT